MNEKYTPPLIILGAEIDGIADFPGFMDTDEHSAKSKLEKPTYLRYMGWNLLTLDTASINGNYWEVKNGDRKTIRLFRDGSLVASAWADDGFLGWGKSHEEFLKSPELNNLALIEYVFEFVNLYRELIPFFGKADKIRFRATFKNTVINNNHLFFKPGIKGPGYFDIWPPYTSKNDFSTVDVVIEIKNGSFNSGEVSYLLLREIYANFGATQDKLPFVKNDDKGVKYIDSEQIKKIG